MNKKSGYSLWPRRPFAAPASEQTWSVKSLPRSLWDRTVQPRHPFKIITKFHTTKFWQALGNFLKGGCSFPIHQRWLLSLILTQLTCPFITKLLSSVQTPPAPLHHNNFYCASNTLFHNKQTILYSHSFPFPCIFKPFLTLSYKQ